VERQATPEFLTKLNIQLFLAVFPVLDTTRVFEVFGVQCAKSTLHIGIQKTDLQAKAGKSPDHVAINETEIQFISENYWLYTGVNPETN